MVKIVLMLLWDLAVMLNDNALGTSRRALHSEETKAFKMSITISSHLSIIIFFFCLVLYLHFDAFDHTALSYTLEAKYADKSHTADKEHFFPLDSWHLQVKQVHIIAIRDLK